MEKQEPTIEELTEQRNQHAFNAGQKQFTKAVIEAELLQINQEILRLNNEIGAKAAASPKKTEEPLRVVTPEVVQDIPVPAMGA